MAQGKADSSYHSANQTNDREDQQISQRHDKDKPGDLLVAVLDGSNECRANSHKHDEETCHCDTEQQKAGDFTQQAGGSDEEEEAALSGKTAGLIGNQCALG